MRLEGAGTSVPFPERCSTIWWYMKRKRRWQRAKQRGHPSGGVDPRPILDELEPELAHALERARTLVEGHDGFDVAANLMLGNLPLDPDTYKESTHPGLIVLAELGALLALSTGRRAPETLTPQGSLEILHAERYDELANALRRCLDVGMLVSGLRAAGPRLDDAATIGFVKRSRQIAVRGPSFHHQEEQTLRDLFGSFEKEFTELVGYDVEQALALTVAAGRLPFEKYADRARRAMADRAGVAAVVSGRGAQDGDVRTEQALQLFTAAFLGTTMSVTASELGTAAGVPREVADVFLKSLSVGFDEPIDPAAMFDGRNPLRKRPFLHDGTGSYLLVSPPNLMFGLRGVLEDALRPSRYWRRYERMRSDYVETTAVDALATALRPERVLRTVFWRDGDALVETDGLLLLDSAVIIVEAKGKQFRPAAERGLPTHLTQDLKKIVTEAADQVRRLRDRIEADHSLTIVDTKGNEEVLDLTMAHEICGIAVALEDISIVATAGGHLVDAGLRRRGSGEALALSLHPLLTICELVEFPAQLVHYLLRRDRLHRQGNVMAFEELDFFMYYLRRGLFFDEMKPHEFVWIESMTDDLDAYYMWLHGERSVEAPKPRQAIAELILALLQQLDAARPRGWLATTLRILEGDAEVRSFIADHLLRLKAACADDGEVHDFSYTFKRKPAAGVTVMASPPLRLDELRRKVRLYAALKKYQTRSDEWFAIGVMADGELHLEALEHSRAPWSYDAGMEAVVRTMPKRGMVPLGPKKRRRR